MDLISTYSRFQTGISCQNNCKKNCTVKIKWPRTQNRWGKEHKLREVVVKSIIQGQNSYWTTKKWETQTRQSTVITINTEIGVRWNKSRLKNFLSNNGCEWVWSMSGIFANQPRMFRTYRSKQASDSNSALMWHSRITISSCLVLSSVLLQPDYIHPAICITLHRIALLHYATYDCKI